jgi:Sulfite exporter TauE/SafE
VSQRKRALQQAIGFVPPAEVSGRYTEHVPLLELLEEPELADIVPLMHRLAPVIIGYIVVTMPAFEEVNLFITTLDCFGKV